MKTTVLIVVCLLCLVGVAQAGEPNLPQPDPVEGLAVWGVSEAAADSLLEVRLGFETKSRFEPGIGVKYITGNPKWGPSPDIITAYLLYHVNEIGEIDDPEPDSAWEEILHSLGARPYGGLEVAVPMHGDERQARTNFIVGTLFSNDPTFKWSFCVEYIVGDLVGGPDNQALRIGGRFRF